MQSAIVEVALFVFGLGDVVVHDAPRAGACILVLEVSTEMVFALYGFGPICRR